MGLFPRILKRSDDPLKDPNHRLWGFLSPRTKAGTSVNEDSAIKYLTLFACVSLIAGDIARLPLILYRKIGTGKERATDHPLYDILHNTPNPETNSFNWRESKQAESLLWGNCYSIIERGRLTNTVKALWHIDKPGTIELKRDSNKRLFYRWRDDNGNVQTKYRNEILHIPGFSFNGLKGVSNIAVAREAIGLGLALEEFGARYFGEGMNMSGVVTLDNDLGEDEDEYIAKLKSQYAGLGKSHGIMVFQNGEKYQPLSIPMEDAQFIESRKFQKTELCGFYHVPPHKIAVHGENSNYNNLEQENQSYVDSCLMHWVCRWESCLNMQLLTPEERRAGYFFEFLIDGLLRGDSKTRSEFYRNIWQIGGITPEEIRARENMNPLNLPGSDKVYIPLNFIPMDQAGASPDSSGDYRSVKRAVNKRKFENVVKARDRLRKRFLPIITGSLTKIVEDETGALTRELGRLVGERSSSDFMAFLDDFYKDFPELIDRAVRPAFTSFMESMYELVSVEIGVDDSDVESIKADVNKYIAGFVRQYINASRGQMVDLMNNLDLESVQARVTEWTEKRVDKEVNETSVGMGSMIARLTILGAGYRAVWRTRGNSCPLCNQLDGRAVGRMGQAFTDDSEDFEDGNGNTVNFRQTLYSPLHAGCDCVIVAE